MAKYTPQQRAAYQFKKIAYHIGQLRDLDYSHNELLELIFLKSDNSRLGRLLGNEVIIRMSSIKLIIFDCEHVLRIPRNGIASNRVDDWHIPENVKTWFNNNAGRFIFGIAANQGGVSAGYVDNDTACDSLYALAKALGIETNNAFLCPSLNSDDIYRLPNTGMIKKIMQNVGASQKQTILVSSGPCEFDTEKAANTLGCFYMPSGLLFRCTDRIPE